MKKNINILLLETNREIIKLVKKELDNSKMNAKVIVPHHKKDHLNAIKKMNYDLLLVNNNGLNQQNIDKVIFENEKRKKPVIFLSNLNSDKVMLNIDKQATDYIKKKISLPMLANEILNQVDLETPYVPKTRMSILSYLDDTIDVKRISYLLEDAGLLIKLVTANADEEYKKNVMQKSFDIIILGYDAISKNGAIDKCHLKSPNEETPIIIIGGNLSSKEAFDLVKKGQFEYLRLDCQDYLPFLILNVLKLKEQEKENIENKNVLNALLTSSNAGIFKMDLEGNGLYVNQRMLNIFGVDEEKLMEKKWSSFVHPEDKNRVYAQWTKVVPQGKRFEATCRIITQQRQIAWLYLTATPDTSFSGQITGYIGTVFDITHLKKTEEKLKKLAVFDSLTNLANRRMFHITLYQFIRRSERHNKSFALLYCDIDDFKKVNDTLGHIYGDKLLKIIANRLKNTIRIVDFIARIGGDEFAIIMNDVTITSVRFLIKRLFSALEKPVELREKQYFVKMSIGVAIYPYAGKSAVSLLKHADLGLYSAKEQVGNTFIFYRKELNNRVHRSVAIEGQLHFAIEKEEFELCYQPLLKLDSQRIVGLEVLLRWHNQELGTVSPEEFIPIAEESGIILAVGDWIITEALKQLSTWINRYPNDFFDISLAINLSPRQLAHDKLVQNLEENISKYKINPSSICFEITEHAIMSNTQKNINLLNQIRNIGCSIAMDDFGTGYSSLNYLRMIPCSILKIDKSFINKIGANKYDTDMIKAIISMAKFLNLAIIAEGVETKAQVDFLKENQCDYIQGFYLSKPMKKNNVIKFLHQKQSVIN